MLHALRPACLAVLAATALACSDNPLQPPPPSGPTPEYAGTVVQANPQMTIAASATVSATLFDSAFVRYWTGTSMPGRTPSIAFNGDSVVRLPILGLDASSDYTFEINLVEDGEAPVAVDTMTFATGGLPAWIPTAVPQGASPQPGYLILSYPDGPVIIDNTGRVVWYLFAPGGVLNSFQAHPGGIYSLLATGGDSTFRLYDAEGSEVDRLRCLNRPTRFHDLLLAADGSSWIMCDESRTMDLSAIGGDPAANVTATVLQHLDAAGQLVWEWNAFDYFQVSDLDPAFYNGGPNVNFTHGNGIAFDADGNILMSFRSLSEATKIDASSGAVIWRFGGLANEFTLVGDPKGAFERIHGLRPVSPGEIQFIDNSVGPPSRFVRYAMDPVAKTATLVWEYIDDPTTWSPIGGSTQAFADGGGLVSFGQEGRVVEVDAAGTRTWELTGIDNTYVFRASRIRSLYAPGAEPQDTR